MQRLHLHWNWPLEGRMRAAQRLEAQTMQLKDHQCRTPLAALLSIELNKLLP